MSGSSGWMPELEEEEAFEVGLTVEDRYAIVVCRGELDLATVDKFHDALMHVLGCAPLKVLVDLEDVTFFSAQGAEVLSQAKGACDAAGIKFDLTTSPIVERVLGMTGLDAPIQRRGELEARGQE